MLHLYYLYYIAFLDEEVERSEPEIDTVYILLFEWANPRDVPLTHLALLTFFVGLFLHHYKLVFEGLLFKCSQQIEPGFPLFFAAGFNHRWSFVHENVAGPHRTMKGKWVQNRTVYRTRTPLWIATWSTTPLADNWMFYIWDSTFFLFLVQCQLYLDPLIRCLLETTLWETWRYFLLFWSFYWKNALRYHLCTVDQHEIFLHWFILILLFALTQKIDDSSNIIFVLFCFFFLEIPFSHFESRQKKSDKIFRYFPFARLIPLFLSLKHLEKDNIIPIN